MLSTIEAKYVAVTHVAKEGLWLQQLIGEVFHPLAHLIPLHLDSQSAIVLTKDESIMHTPNILTYNTISFVLLLKMPDLLFY